MNSFDPIARGVSAKALALALAASAALAPATLTNNFALGTYLNAGTSYGSFASWLTSVSGTFTRSGANHRYVSSTGLLLNSTANTPRFTYDPVTLESIGLLYEPDPATNLMANSRLISTTTWAFSNANVSIADNVATGPDGTTSAGKVTETAASGGHRMWYYNSADSVTIGHFYAFQIMLKAAGRDKITITPNANSGLGAVTVDLTLGTVSNSSYTLEAWQNGWFRLWKTSTATATGIPDIIFNLLDAAGNTSYLGNGTSGILVTCAQLEEVSAVTKPPTSYVERAGTGAVTRAADAIAFTIPAGVSKLTYTFGDGSTQVVTVSPGAYTVPNTLTVTTPTGLALRGLTSVDLTQAVAPVRSVFGRIGDVRGKKADIEGLKDTSSPTFSTVNLSQQRMSIGGSILKNGTATATFQWTTSRADLSDRAICIGAFAGSGVTSSWQNSMVIGNDAAKNTTTLGTAVVIGDTAGGSCLAIVGANLLGNEAGNSSTTAQISGCNIIGNGTNMNGSAGNASNTDVLGQLGMRYMRGVDTVAVGWSAGTGAVGTPGSHTQSTFLGSKAGMSLVGARTGNFMLGYAADAPTTTTDNYFNVNGVLKGDMAAGTYSLTKPAGTAATLTVDAVAVRQMVVSGTGAKINPPAYTVATLPGSPSIGDAARVTDALTPVYGSSVAGGGTKNVPVNWDGTNWNVG